MWLMHIWVWRRIPHKRLFQNVWAMEKIKNLIPLHSEVENLISITHAAILELHREISQHETLTCPTSFLYAERCTDTRSNVISPNCGRQPPGWHTGSRAKLRGSWSPPFQRSMTHSSLRWILWQPARTGRLWRRRCPHRAGCTLTGSGSPVRSKRKERNKKLFFKKKTYADLR